MVRPILACQNPYETAARLEKAGWKIDFSQPPESGDPLVGVSLWGNSLLLGVTEGYVSKAGLPHIGCGVVLYLTVPGQLLPQVRENHAFFHPAALTEQPWGDAAFEVTVDGFRLMIAAKREEPSPLRLRFGEVEEAVRVMREVAAWGRERGWRVWPDQRLTPEALLSPDAQRENFCVGRMDGETACAFILQWSDAEFWPHAPKYEAGYLHKFCVRREFAGMGMTGLAVEAVRRECRRRGVRYLRLDTALDEKTVRKIYLRAGFRIVDIIDYDSGRSMALYELEV